MVVLGSPWAPVEKRYERPAGGELAKDKMSRFLVALHSSPMLSHGFSPSALKLGVGELQVMYSSYSAIAAAEEFQTAPQCGSNCHELDASG